MHPLRSLVLGAVLLSSACGGPPLEEAAEEVAESRAALCSCSFISDYQVPVTTQLCHPDKSGNPVCAPAQVLQWVRCQNQCISCGTVTCYDMTTGTPAVAPSAQYLIGTAWFPCNARNVCG